MYNFSINEMTFRMLSLASVISSLFIISDDQINLKYLAPVILMITCVYFVSSIYLMLGRKLNSDDILFGLPVSISFIYVFISIGDFLSIIDINFNNFSLNYFLISMSILIVISNLLFGTESEFEDDRILDLDFNVPSKVNVLYCIAILFLSVIAGSLSKQGLDALSYIFILTIILSPFLYLRELSIGGSTNLLIFFSSLSIMFLSTSSVEYASNFDISRDVYHSTTALETSNINLFASSSYSTILSVQALLPWISVMSGLTIDDSILFSHSLISSLVILMIHRIYVGAFDNIYSGIAIYLPMTTVQFFVGQMSLWRQGVAELAIFSILAIAVLHSFRKSERRILVRLFLIFVVISHYSIAYVFLFIFVFARLGNSIFTEAQFFSITEEKEEDELFGEEEDLGITSIGLVDTNYKNPGFSTNDIMIMGIFLIFWHTISGQGYVIDQVIFLSDSIINQLSNNSLYDLFIATQVVDEISSTNTLFHTLSALFTGMIIFIGALGLLVEIRNGPTDSGLINLISMSSGVLVLVIFLLIIPDLGYRLNLIRFVQWAIIFISPFTISFIIYIFNPLNQFKDENSSKMVRRTTLSLITVLIVFNSGLLFEINNEDPRWNLDSESDSPSLTHSEYSAGEFAAGLADSFQYPGECIASDKNRQGSIVRFISESNVSYTTVGHFEDAGITVHGQWNLEEKSYYLRNASNDNNKLEYLFLNDFWQRENSVIFDSGNSKVYYFPCEYGG